MKAKDLPLPKEATNVEYKGLVEHITFKSKLDMKSLAAEISKQLAAQGWTTDGVDLVAKTVILHRKRGAAEPTIMVKPGSAGSEVQIFTEGLVWDE